MASGPSLIVCAAGFAPPCVALKFSDVGFSVIAGGPAVTVNITLTVCVVGLACGAVKVIVPLYVPTANVPGFAETVIVNGVVPADGSADNRRMKLTLTTMLNRRDFGLVWNTLILSVAGELTVNLAIEATPAT